jgi:SAM-dependent methyltransferase
MGRWSHLVARDFLAWLALPPGGAWLDVGCGTGELSRSILAAGAARALTGVDLSAAYIAYARAQTEDERAKFEVADAQALPFSDGVFDAVVSGLMLNFVAQPDRMLEEMARVLRPGGMVAVYVWDYAGRMGQLRTFWDAAAALDPAAAALDEGLRFPICQPERLAAHLRAAHLEQVEGQPIEVTMRFRDFDDYWSPFLGGQGPAPGYVASLTAQQRTALRDRLQRSLPVAGDGSLSLSARAWAVRGRRAPCA